MNSDQLNILMTMDYYIQSMVRKGKLAIFEGSNISKTREVTPTKIGVYVCHMGLYLHKFFEPIPID